MLETSSLTVLPPAPAPCETVTVLTPLPLIPAEVHADFTPARDSLHRAKLAGIQSMGYMILAGQHLNALHKKYAIGKGRPNKSEVNFGIKWPELVHAELGISDNWAGKLMHMADLSKKHLPEMAQQLSLPFAEWNDERLQKLNEAIHKASDAETYTELMQEWGVLKKSRNGASPNPAGRDEGTVDTRTPEQQACDLCYPCCKELGLFLLDPNHEAAIKLLPLALDPAKDILVSLQELDRQLKLASELVAAELKARRVGKKPKGKAKKRAKKKGAIVP